METLSKTFVALVVCLVGFAPIGQTVASDVTESNITRPVTETSYEDTYDTNVFDIKVFGSGSFNIFVNLKNESENKDLYCSYFRRYENKSLNLTPEEYLEFITTSTPALEYNAVFGCRLTIGSKIYERRISIEAIEYHCMVFGGCRSQQTEVNIVSQPATIQNFDGELSVIPNLPDDTSSYLDCVIKGEDKKNEPYQTAVDFITTIIDQDYESCSLVYQMKKKYSLKYYLLIQNQDSLEKTININLPKSDAEHSIDSIVDEDLMNVITSIGQSPNNLKLAANEYFIRQICHGCEIIRYNNVPINRSANKSDFDFDEAYVQEERPKIVIVGSMIDTFTYIAVDYYAAVNESRATCDFYLNDSVTPLEYNAEIYEMWIANTDLRSNVILKCKVNAIFTDGSAAEVTKDIELDLETNYCAMFEACIEPVGEKDTDYRDDEDLAAIFETEESYILSADAALVDSAFLECKKNGSYIHRINITDTIMVLNIEEDTEYILRYMEASPNPLRFEISFDRYLKNANRMKITADMPPFSSYYNDQLIIMDDDSYDIHALGSSTSVGNSRGSVAFIEQGARFQMKRIYYGYTQKEKKLSIRALEL